MFFTTWSPGVLTRNDSGFQEYEIARNRMVKDQIVRRGITDERVLASLRSVPRHLFVDQAFWPRAYSDHPLPIEFDQTISQPYIVALMTQELAISGTEKVLEIGTGSGYQAAVLAGMGCTVYTVERIPGLAHRAAENIRKLGLKNVYIRIGDGTLGWKEKAPFDRIIVTAGAPSVPEVLMNQLSSPGKMVLPVGDRVSQQLLVIQRNDQVIEKRYVAGCTFVPLVGEFGWENG
jgi:protein-L-isoaspartate(D-aspartate) O-methyltransferase